MTEGNLAYSMLSTGFSKDVVENFIENGVGYLFGPLDKSIDFDRIKDLVDKFDYNSDKDKSVV